MEPVNVENLVMMIEEPSAESWHSVLLKLLEERKRIKNNPESICLTLLRKIEEVGFKDKSSAWNISQFISYSLRHFIISNEFRVPSTDALYSKLTDRSSTSKLTWPIVFRSNLPTSELNLLKFLLNYGLLQPVDTDINEVRRAIRSCLLLRDKTESMYLNQMHEMRALNDRLDGTFLRARGLKRLMLTAKCIHILIWQRRSSSPSNTAEQYTEYLRLYFRGIPDPYVQAEEVREFITLFLVNFSSQEAIDTLVTDIRSLFPESEAPYGPRSLRHLCRCRVRDILSQKSEVLPQLVNSLKIPDVLKAYILGDL